MVVLGVVALSYRRWVVPHSPFQKPCLLLYLRVCLIPKKEKN